MKLRRSEIFAIVLALATFLFGILIYPYLPERIASHWGLNNQVNGYMGKFWGVFLLPIIMLVCVVIFLIVTRIDPKKENIQKFEKYFDLFIMTFMFFFVYIYALTIFWNLGYHFILIQFMMPMMAVLFYVTGIMIKHAEPNLTIGIRTPRTIANDDVWYKTHKLGGKLFQALAVMIFLGAFVPKYALFVILLPVIFVVIFLFAYSYYEYKKISTSTSKP